MTLTPEAVDALRARLDAEPEPPAWAEPMYASDPDDDSDSDGETDESPTAEVEVPVIVDADPADTMTLLQHEAAEFLCSVYPTATLSGSQLLIPLTMIDRRQHRPISFLLIHPVRVSLDTFPLVFGGGTWVNLDHPALTGA